MKKKIVFFDAVVHFGGSNQATIALVRELKKYSDVLILDAYGTCRPYHEAINYYGIENIVVQQSPKRSYVGGKNILERTHHLILSASEIFDLIIRLRQVVKKILPHVICVYSYKGLFLISRAIGNKIPIVFYAHGEGIYPRWYNRFDWRNISLTLGVSESCFSRLSNSPYASSVMKVVPNGINIDETINATSANPENVPSDKGLRVIIPASLLPNKNQDIAIKGLAKFIKRGGNGSLWLCGDYFEGADSTYADSLPGLAKDLHISEHVHFLGWRDNIPALIAECDIAALISHTESFGRVFLEAMCLKKPVIGTRVGGIPEVVRDGIDGILIDVDDSDAFADALANLSDPEVRQRMGAAGLERVKACFDIRKIALRYYDLISRVC